MNWQFIVFAEQVEVKNGFDEYGEIFVDSSLKMLDWSTLLATKCQSVSFLIMTHALDRSLSSLAAIAAASLLLSTSPASAQATQAQPPDAATAPAAPAAAAPQAATNPAPSEVPAPPPAPAAPPAPATPPTTDMAPVATPAPQAPTMTSNPVVQAVPDSSTPAQAQSAADAADSAATPAKQAAPRAHAEPRAAQPAARPAPTETSRTTTQAVTTQAAKPADSGSGLTRRDPAGLYKADDTAAAPAAAPAPSSTSSDSDMERYWPIGAAGAVLVLGLAGFALTRRRDEEEVEAEAVVTPTGRTYVDPSYFEPAANEPVDAVAQADAQRLAEAEVVPEAPVAEVTPVPVRRRKRADSPEGVMLREGPLPTGEERAELLKRMMEAEPDEANPFHTPRARMRRARLILQTREKELRDKATERFDWRTYKPSMKQAVKPVAQQGKTGAVKAEPVK